MERLFQLLAVVLAGAAAYFLWAGQPNASFVTAVLGSVAFFLSIRFPMKKRNVAREAEREAMYNEAEDQRTESEER